MVAALEPRELLKTFNAFLAKAAPSWKRYHAIADKLRPKVRRAFLEAVAKAQKGVDLSKMEVALKAKDWRAAESLIDWEEFGSRLGELTLALSAAFRAAGQLASKELAQTLLDGGLIDQAALTGTGFTTGFDLRNKKAEAWAKKHGAKLIREVGDETKAAVRTIIQTAIKDGIPPKKAARQIRGIVGHTERQAQAVLNFRARLERQMERGKSPFKTVVLTDEKVNSMVEKYGAKLLKYRAEMIARQETLTAASEGRLAGWREMAEQGYLQPDQVERVFSVTHDDRLCPICAGMEGQAIGLDGEYQSVDVPLDKESAVAQYRQSMLRIADDDTRAWMSHDSIDGAVEQYASTIPDMRSSPLPSYTAPTPPIHIQCRCSERLRFLGEL